MYLKQKQQAVCIVVCRVANPLRANPFGANMYSERNLSARTSDRSETIQILTVLSYFVA